MKRKSLKSEYDNFTMYQVSGYVRYGQTVLSKRVWWKPWTWRRKSIFIGGEWEKREYTHAAPKFRLSPTSDFDGEIDSVSVRLIGDTPNGK